MGLALRSLADQSIRDRRGCTNRSWPWPEPRAAPSVSLDCPSSFPSPRLSCCARSPTSPEAKARIWPIPMSRSRASRSSRSAGNYAHRRSEWDGVLETGYFAMRGLLAKSVSRGRAPSAWSRAVRPGVSPAGSFHRAGQRAVWHRGFAKGRRAKRAADRRRQRSGDQLRLRRSFPDAGARPFHGPPSRTDLWRRQGADGIRTAGAANLMRPKPGMR